MIHEYTPTLTDSIEWREARYPENDVIIEHTSECDSKSCGDECIGGCPVVDE